MAIKIHGQDLVKRYINGQEVVKCMMNGVQIRPDSSGSDDYLYVEATSSWATLQLHRHIQHGTLPSLQFEVSNDKINWTPFFTEVSYIFPNVGEKWYIRNTSETPTGFSTDYSNYFFFEAVNIKFGWNVNSLLSKHCINNALSNYCFAHLFSECYIEDIKLPATTLAQGCYASMFENATFLGNLPILPATQMANGCYSWMFMEAYGLNKGPSTPPISLPSTSLAVECYNSMFAYSDIVVPPVLPATTLKDGCYSWMFNNCDELRKAPHLPATNLAQDCYFWMFAGCTSLVEIPALPATTFGNTVYYDNMFQGCSRIEISKNPDYPYVYRIPSSGTGTYSPEYFTDMFKDTGWLYKWDGKINTTYYTSNTIV